MVSIRPTETTQGDVTGGVAQPGAMVPIDRPQSERGSFWKRLSARRSVRRAQLLHDVAPQDAVLARLDEVDERLRGLEAAVELSAERLEARFLQFWEMEEQLGTMLAKLTDLETSQRDLAERTRTLSRSTTLLAIFALATAVIAIALSLPLGA